MDTIENLDDIYDDLSLEEKNYIDSILDGSNTILGLYRDKFQRNGGWNGMMDAINEFEKLNNIESVPLGDDLEQDVDVMALVVAQMQN